MAGDAVLLPEMFLNGHHANYLCRIATHFLQQGCEVHLIVAASSSTHPELDRLCRGYPGAVHLHLLDDAACKRALWGGRSQVVREFRVWLLLRRACLAVRRQTPVALTFVPYLDYCLHSLALLGAGFFGSRWAAVTMRPAFHQRAEGVIAPPARGAAIKRWLFFALLRQRGLESLYAIDPTLVAHVRRTAPTLADRLRHFPDPVTPPRQHDVAALRQRYGIAMDACVIVLFGAIDLRKGIRELLMALELPQARHWVLLIVGRQEEPVHQLLGEARWQALLRDARVLQRDAYVSEDVEHEVFALADAVWLGYRGHYAMSGVLVRAGTYRKPVLACREGLIGWYARRAGLGLLCDPAPEDIARALCALEDPDLAARLGERGQACFAAQLWSDTLALLPRCRDSQR